MKFRLSTSLTLALVFSLLAGLSQWASYQIAGELQEATVREHEIDKVKTVGNIVTALIRQQDEHVALVAHLLAAQDDVANGVIAAAAHGADFAPGTQALDDSFARARVDTLEMIDAQGTVVYRADDPARHGDRATGWGVDEALNGQGSVVGDIGPRGAAVRAFEPLRRGGKIVGAVAVGLRFDTRLVKSLSAMAGAEIALLPRKGAAIVSEPTLVQRIDDSAMAEAFRQKIPVYRVDNADRHTRAYLPVLIVDEAFVVMTEIDASSAYDLLERSAKRSAAYTLGILVASVLLALLTLRYVLQPLRGLRVRAQQTALAVTGQAIQVRQQDEVAAVVEVLDTLTEQLLRRNRELAEAKAAADAASEAKSRFLSTMSHEIRTPLTGVLGMAELLQLTPLNPEQARYARAITASGQSLHDLLSNILDLAKIDDGMVQVERMDFEPARVLAELADTYRELASSHGIVLATDFDPAAPRHVSGDPGRLRQVLTNLLGNALKFSPRGSIRLSSLRLDSPPGDSRIWLRFSVLDTGVGIAAEALPQLFQPFVQADATTTRRFGGTGLGLAICKHLVELMGGQIHVRSQPGAGSTFWFDLPFEAPSGPEPAPRPPAPAPLAAPLRVLVAEDNPINQEIVRALLINLGATVTVVGNGELAVQAVQREPFDAILMDCHMPGLDGYEATARIRALQRSGPRIPIIAFTANAFAEDLQRCTAAGMDDFLAKPINSAKLADVLVRHALRPVTSPTPAAPHDDGPSAPAVKAVAPPVVTTDAMVFDPTVLAALPMVADGSNVAFAQRLLKLHDISCAAALEEIEAALAAGDTARMRERLHGLKSSSAQVGALALAALAAGFEQQLRDQQAPAAAWLAQLRQAHRELQQARGPVPDTSI